MYKCVSVFVCASACLCVRTEMTQEFLVSESFPPSFARMLQKPSILQSPLSIQKYSRHARHPQAEAGRCGHRQTAVLHTAHIGVATAAIGFLTLDGVNSSNYSSNCRISLVTVVMMAVVVKAEEVVVVIVGVVCCRSYYSLLSSSLL